MDNKALMQELNEYVELVTQMRVLSAVQIDEAVGAEHYSQKLREDYKKIGELGKKSREILLNTVYPHIAPDACNEMCFDELIALQNFCEMLLEPASGEELDLSLLFKLSDRLISEFIRIGDDDGYVKQLHIHINVCYANVNRTSRLLVSPELCTFYRNEGLKASEEIKKYFYDKEKFLSLNETARTYATRGMRFYSALYDTFFATEEGNIERYEALIEALKVCDDPFYREALPNYDWERQRYRCIEHMGQLTERGNRWGFSKEKCLEICSWIALLEDLWEKDEVRAAKIIHEGHFRLILLRNKYFAGMITKKEYQEKLLELYDTWSNNLYDMHSVQFNLLIPAEYLASIRGERISVRIQDRIKDFYDRVVKYVLNSVNRDAFNYLQEYMIAFLEEFIELPGCRTFEEMGLQCLAAIHPPTYVHSLQVADISKYLADCLIDKSPELFLKEFNYNTTDEVIKNKGKIESFIYKAGLCHDFGKITMIDTIFVYGRDLLDAEVQIIKLHTKMGARMLGFFDSTRDYAELSMQHHVWYNEEAGYPTVSELKNPVCTSILSLADCIDAATDSIGRSYNEGKSLEDLIVEFDSERGSRYAPFVVDLLKDEDVFDDIKYLLEEGRQNNYIRTYQLLAGVKNRVEA